MDKNYIAEFKAQIKKESDFRLHAHNFYNYQAGYVSVKNKHFYVTKSNKNQLRQIV